MLKTQNRMKVYVNGYGLRPFRIEETIENPTQYKGSFELPKGVERADGEKWIKLDYYFTEKELIAK
ncbi:hypothetical protein O8E88_002239 [Flavobacterium psychrophilum]|uniref:hypothetical protein n=1 Tax=Flavobacterium psychrophilum TaxID=96345 RepID=UPI0004F8263E|nr:hypothetical protein [Flavobacterium psychrophilum]AIN75162.1 hypothetical protein FPG3_06990 [Flavobacterium psychrophilum FPG3]EKT2070412.1 hypothetical protein [Flavobacterium psychrophilum]EKT2072886.1 hypothetical protein [Flavobacterium psychrophilum]EKT4492301.1 hypothetical protein [Flavobacterium psychrophilum]MBF2045257.1 hypothetical protein [Flavobacterium psychrophilum]